MVRDRRIPAIVILAAGVLAIGTALQWQPAGPAKMEPSKSSTPDYQPFARQSSEVEERVYLGAPTPLDPDEDPRGHAQQYQEQVLQISLNSALAFLRANRFEEAIHHLERILELSPHQPGVLANLGFARIGTGDYQGALSAFDQAIELKPTQANAYYGSAVALEALGDIEAALGGMRSFLHTTDMGPEKLWVARARSAIWEWEADLGRGPWGPTKGIPPGFSKEELKRDGGGVGLKMPLWETRDEDGNMEYVIKHQDKFKLFDE